MYIRALCNQYRETLNIKEEFIARILRTHPDLPYNLGASNFVREFGSLFVDFGRRTGKSEFVRTYASPGDLIIVHSAREVTRLKYEGLTEGVHICAPTTICDPDYTAYRRIFIDEPALCAKAYGSYGFYYNARFNAQSIVIGLGRAF